MKQPLKARLIGVCIALLFLLGFAILFYPVVSNQWNTWRQSRLISAYNSAVTETEEEDLSQEWVAGAAETEGSTGLAE